MTVMTLTPENATGLPGSIQRYTAAITSPIIGTLTCVWYVDGVEQASKTRFFNYLAAGSPGTRTIKCVGTFIPGEGDPTPQILEKSVTYIIQGVPTALSVELKARHMKPITGELLEYTTTVSYGQKLHYEAIVSGDEGPGTYSYDFIHPNTQPVFSGAINNTIKAFINHESFLDPTGKPLPSFPAYVVVTFTPDSGGEPIIFSSPPVRFTLNPYDYFPTITLSHDKDLKRVSAAFNPEVPSNFYMFSIFDLIDTHDFRIRMTWSINGYVDNMWQEPNYFDYLDSDIEALGDTIMLGVEIYFKGAIHPIHTQFLSIKVSDDPVGPVVGTCPFIYIHPLPWRDSAYINVGWWVMDEIQALTKEGKDWKTDASGKYMCHRLALAKMITDYPEVDVQESRHGYIIHKSVLNSGIIYPYP